MISRKERNGLGLRAHRGGWLGGNAASAIGGYAGWHSQARIPGFADRWHVRAHGRTRGIGESGGCGCEVDLTERWWVWLSGSGRVGGDRKDLIFSEMTFYSM
jgi:hypothetical protein